MNKVIIVFIILLFSNSAFSYDGLSLPKIFFEFSFLYDGNCEKPNDYINIKSKGLKKLPLLKKYWDTEGSKYFQVLFDDLEKGFKRRELTGTITFCGHGSYSTPLVIDLYREIVNDDKRPEFSFGLLVFHELLHTYVRNNIKWPTRLIKKYSIEDRKVKSHLHLMALQLYVFRKLNLKLEEDYISWWYNAIGGSYKRSWEIISSLEDYNSFVDELR